MRVLLPRGLATLAGDDDLNSTLDNLYARASISYARISLRLFTGRSFNVSFVRLSWCKTSAIVSAFYVARY